MNEILNEKERAVVASELSGMARRDQEARRTASEEGNWDGVAAVDEKNVGKLADVIDRMGWPTVSKVGEGAAHAAWMIAQHADHNPGFQRRCLDLMKGESPEDVSLEDVGYLEDRVLVAEGEPQMYGTQWKFEDGRMVPEEIRDRESVDERRESVGMGSFEEYAKAMRGDEG